MRMIPLAIAALFSTASGVPLHDTPHPAPSGSLLARYASAPVPPNLPSGSEADPQGFVVVKADRLPNAGIWFSIEGDQVVRSGMGPQESCVIGHALVMVRPRATEALALGDLELNPLLTLVSEMVDTTAGLYNAQLNDADRQHLEARLRALEERLEALARRVGDRTQPKPRPVPPPTARLLEPGMDPSRMAEHARKMAEEMRRFATEMRESIPHDFTHEFRFVIPREGWSHPLDADRIREIEQLRRQIMERFGQGRDTTELEEQLRRLRDAFSKQPSDSLRYRIWERMAIPPTSPWGPQLGPDDEVRRLLQELRDEVRNLRELIRGRGGPSPASLSLWSNDLALVSFEAQRALPWTSDAPNLPYQAFGKLDKGWKVPSSEAMAEFMRSLSPQQVELHHARGYLTPSDLSPQQLAILGHLPGLPWEVSLTLGDHRITIRNTTFAPAFDS